MGRVEPGGAADREYDSVFQHRHAATCRGDLRAVQDVIEVVRSETVRRKYSVVSGVAVRGRQVAPPALRVRADPQEDAAHVIGRPGVADLALHGTEQAGILGVAYCICPVCEEVVTEHGAGLWVQRQVGAYRSQGLSPDLP